MCENLTSKPNRKIEKYKKENKIEKGKNKSREAAAAAAPTRET